MALLKKKDPLSERAKALNVEIAELEAKIRKLDQQAGGKAVKEVNKSGARVRSTALPNGATVASVKEPEPEPVFEEVDQEPIKQAPVRRSATTPSPLEDVSV